MEEEYKMLREEIMFNINKTHWYISGVSTIGIALLAYIIKSPSNIVLLSLFLAILVIVEGRIFALTKAINITSTYMEVFLEPNLENRNWETKLHCDKFQTKKRPLADFVSNTNSVCFLIGTVVIIFNGIVIWDNITLINVVFSCVNLFLVVFLTYMAILNRRGYQDRQEYRKSWEETKKHLETNNNSSSGD